MYPTTYQNLIQSSLEKVRKKGYRYSNFENTLNSVRQNILGDQSQEWLFIKTHFINFNKDHCDLLDIAIFNRISTIHISFLYELKYLNLLVQNTNINENHININVDLLNDDKIISLSGSPNNQTINSINIIVESLKLHLSSLFIKNNLGFMYNINTIDDKIINMYAMNDSVTFNNITHDNMADDSEFKNVYVDDQNASFCFDIDGITAFSNHKEILGIKSNIKMDYKTSSKKNPISKNKFVSFNNQIYPLDDMFSAYIGHVPLSHENRLDIYLMAPEFPCTERKIKEFENILIDMVDIFLNSGRLAHYHTQFRKSNDNQILNISGIVDSLFMSKFIKELSKKSKLNLFYFMESYNTKYTYASTSYMDILHSIQAVFDLDIIVPKIDLCVELRVKDQNKSVLCMKDGFIDSHRDIEQYTLMNCSNISNFHGHLLRSNIRTNKIHSVYGIEKLNIYSPIINFLIPRYITTKKYPTFTGSIIGTNLYGWSADPKHNIRMKKTKSYLSTLQSNIQNSYNIDVGIRFEFRISLLNFISAIEFIKYKILNKSYFLISSESIKYYLRLSLSNIYDIIDIDNKLISIQDIINRIIVEQSIFEYYIRGGNNLNILPKSVGAHINTLKTKYQIKPIPKVIDVTLTADEQNTMFNKLIKYNKNINEDIKNKILNLYNFIHTQHITQQLNTFILTFTSNIQNIFSIDQSVFTSGPSEKLNKNSNPISASEFMDSYLDTPNKNIKHQLYIGQYFYLKHSKPDIIKDIIDLFKENQIRFIPNIIKHSTLIVREIVYDSRNTDKEIDEKLLLVSSSIEHGFYNDFSKANNKKISQRKRDPDITDIEFIFIFQGIKRDATIRGRKMNLYNDLRYPFRYYCLYKRIETGYRTLNTKIKQGKDYNQILADFKIQFFSIVKFTLFLNYIQKKFTSSNAIKIADELLHFANNIDFVEKPVEFYEKLFNNQKDCSKIKNITEIILNSNTESGYEIYLLNNISICQQKTIDEAQEDLNSPKKFCISLPRRVSNYKSGKKNIQDCTSSSESLQNNSMEHLKNFKIQDSILEPLPVQNQEEEKVVDMSMSLDFQAMETPDSSKLMVCEKKEPENIFYSISENSLVISEEGRKVLKLVRESTEKNSKVLEYRKKVIEESGYIYDEVLKFFCELDHHGYIERKRNSRNFIFKFNEKSLFQ